MTESLFKQLKKVGIDEETAYQVSASLDPDYNASQKDVLVMQETILQLQLKSEESYHELRREITEVRLKSEANFHELRHEIGEVRSDLRHDIHTNINRQYILTFGGLLMTIATVVAVNWYFH